MGEHSAIEWTHHTFNPWWGCTRVSPACEHCYAETLAKRFGTGWGVGARRRFFGEQHWAEPVRWNAAAAKAGERRRVFCASMADVFEVLPPRHPDGMPMAAARARLWGLIGATPALDWLLLTKRPESVRGLIPAPWECDGWPRNVWLGTTVEDERRAGERLPYLLSIPAVVRFVSCEPLLGPLGDFGAWLDGAWASEAGHPVSKHALGWVIAGGESGHGARPSHPDWFRALRDGCERVGVPFFFKQWGEWCGSTLAGGTLASDLSRVGKKAAGRVLDGRTWDEVPEPCGG